jgi:hypothetical protein
MTKSLSIGATCLTILFFSSAVALGQTAELPAGPSAAIPSGGKGPGDYPNFTVTAANWVMDASAVPDINGGLRDEVKMNLAGQGPLPWSLTEFGQGRYAPRLNVADPQAAAEKLGKLPFDLIIDGTAYQWENDLDPWAANGAAWRPHPAKGIILPSVRKNGQQWSDGSPLFYGVLATPIELSGGEGYSMLDGSFGGADSEITVGKAGSSIGGSIDTSVAWFPYDQGWLGGHVASADFEEGEWSRDGFHHPDFPADPANMITWTRDLGVIVPPVTISLPDVNSRTDGMLFTISTEQSSANTHLTAVDPNSDGSGWEIMIRSDNDPDPEFAAEAALAFSFLYVPYSAGNLIGGHIRGSDANVINGRGNYSIERLSEGRYELAIPNKKSADGMLILGTAGRLRGGTSGTVSRSFLSYEPTENDRFVIESRFFQSEAEQPLENSDFYFAWVDFARPLSPPGFETVIDPPTIVTHPNSSSIELGATVNFSVAASGSEPFIYQWLFDGTAIIGATEPSYTITGASLDHAGSYVVEVTNGGGKAVSDPGNLKVLAPPNITQHPESLDAATGDSVRFAAMASGTPPLNYQWQKDGIDIAGATSAELILQNISLADAGQYRVSVSNEVKEEISITGRLTVKAILRPPSITQQPTGKDVMLGDSVEFAVLVAGSPPLSFQWQLNGQDIDGQTAASLSIPSVEATHEGLYRVLISNTEGSVTTNEVRLTVASPPVVVQAPLIVQHPTPITVQSGEPARLQVIATGQELAFQWLKDGNNISGATQASVAFESTTESDAGNYHVRVSNPGGTTISALATITVTLPPPVAGNLTITTQPISQTVAPGDSVSFNVTAEGSGVISYQWQLGNFNIPGARASSFSFANVQEIDEGAYRVVISDDTGASITSDVANLNVSTAPIISAHPESQSITEGDNVTFSVEAQGMGALTYQWLFNGNNIPGARLKEFSFAGTQTADSGQYQVVVSDSAGSTTSDIALLTVVARPDTPALNIDRISVTGNTLLIEWQGGPGIILQAKASLDDASWLDIQGTEGQSSVQQLALGISAYFRLIQQ